MKCCDEKTAIQKPAPSLPLVEVKTYFPLILISVYLIGLTLLIQSRNDHFHFMAWMGHFMAGFFLIFSFFKFLNLKGFADAYQTYDVVARKFPLYGWIYPFIELSLGIAYVIHFAPFWTHLFTLGVMGISSVGVIQALMKKQKIECACLGTIFNLPMTKVTLFEDLLMVGMAIAMLLNLPHS